MFERSSGDRDGKDAGDDDVCNDRPQRSLGVDVLADLDGVSTCNPALDAADRISEVR